ncbi:MAG: arylsulfatase [Spirochaetaceae bacterium]
MKPNVILVLTDDQGYGDLGCHGSPWMITPNLDEFYSNSVRFTDFHVSPLCTPTRGALLTGRRPLVNGAWGVFSGRSLLHKDEVTMADIFSDNGYRTGLFGKWHLGDNYPYRPQDRGFQHVVAHKGGGVGQTPDFWGNNYFDDTYFKDGKPVEYEGYCTDVWFDEALKFITNTKEESKDKPFLAVITTNAPHVPYLVDKKYEEPYLDNDNIPYPPFCGMITNIDENFGRLCCELKSQGIEDNTIVIFMTDNGSSGGILLDENKFVKKGFNAGMRGRKGNNYDGGHRVPFFIRWPKGQISGGKDIDELTCHIDLLPTLVDFCELDVNHTKGFDGRSLKALLNNEITEFPDDRVEILHIGTHFNKSPEKWSNTVMTSKWRLVNGDELYDIKNDPEQRNNIASLHLEVVQKLRDHHGQWWNSVSPGLEEYARIPLGNDFENPVKLDAFDVMGDAAVHQIDIVKANRSSGKWAVEVEKAGNYNISLRRWPVELGLPINNCISDKEAKKIAPYGGSVSLCTSMATDEARVKLFDIELSKQIKVSDKEAVFEVEVPEAGETTLEAWFKTTDGQEQGAYYVYVEKI